MPTITVEEKSGCAAAMAAAAAAAPVDDDNVDADRYSPPTEIQPDVQRSLYVHPMESYGPYL